MKRIVSTFLLLPFFVMTSNGQNDSKNLTPGNASDYEIIKAESRIHGLNIAITHQEPTVLSNDYPILCIHGSSFPSALAFGFRMGNHSWIDNLAENGYDVYALDFLGYGNADRYPEMQAASTSGLPLGRAAEVYRDVDKAVDLITKKTGKSKVYLIAHSWGGSVAAMYATKFPDKVAKLVLFAAITTRQDSTAYTNSANSYAIMTPEQRVNAMKNLTPDGETCQLEPEIFESWGNLWLLSDPLVSNLNTGSIRFPAGYAPDIEDMLHNKPLYNPANIKMPTLVIRGEWDAYPNNADAEKLFRALENAPGKKYVVVEKGTHVMHLEKSRYQLYDETLRFLKSGTYEGNK